MKRLASPANLAIVGESEHYIMAGLSAIAWVGSPVFLVRSR